MLGQLRLPPQDGSGVAGAGDGEKRKPPHAKLDMLVPAVLRGRRTIQEIVVEALRDAIVTGRLKGGERLHQDEIASKLGVSRMPVREALRQLESEGLVVFTPHRRVSVAALSAPELREIYEIRSALEILALDLAVPRLTAKEFDQLSALLDQMDRVSDPGRWVDLNRYFHRTLYRASGRARLCTLIDSLRDNVERYLRIYVSAVERRAHAQVEHRRILRACRRRHAAEAKKAMREHLSGTLARLEAFLRSRAPGFGGWG